MQPRSSVQRRPNVASTTTAASTAFAAFFVLPWQALALTVVLTLGATVHARPQNFAPILRYAHGMTVAAIEWHNTPMPSFYAQTGNNQAGDTQTGNNQAGDTQAGR